MGGCQCVHHDEQRGADVAVECLADPANQLEQDVAGGLVHVLGDDRGTVGNVPVDSADADLCRVGDSLGRQRLDVAIGDHFQCGVEQTPPHFAGPLLLREGVRYTADKLDDIYHFWRYVGLLNGVGPELNPAAEADHILNEELYALTATDPDDADRDFVKALAHDCLAVEIDALIPLAGHRTHQYAVSVVDGLTGAFPGMSRRPNSAARTLSSNTFPRCSVPSWAVQTDCSLRFRA